MLEPAAVDDATASACLALKPLRLGFVGDRSVCIADGVWAEPGLGRVLDLCRAAAGRFTFSMSVCPEPQPLFNHRLAAPESELVSLHWVQSIARGFFRVRECRRAIREVERSSDVVIVQGPYAASLALLAPRTPRVYHLVHNIRSIVDTSSHYRGLRRLAGSVAARTIDRIQTSLIRRADARCVTHGAALLRHIGEGHGRSVVSSALRADEIGSVARRRPPDAPFRVLFVGYLRHEKGVDVLLDAFEQLVAQVPRAELVVVGADDAVDYGLKGNVARAMNALRDRGKIVFRGARAFGPELFQEYADADVLAVPSRAEGTPRVLIEARAFGCAVVGTAVDGIPDSIEHEIDGLLMPPDDPAALTAALARIAGDEQLRAQLRSAGYERARRTTVEQFTAEILAEVVRVARQAGLLPAA